MSRKVAEPGTIIAGTMRPFPVANTLLAALEYLDLEAYDLIVDAMPPDMADGRWDDAREAEYWESEAGAYLIEALFDALQECAPPGHYFGSHPGDGADVGFWPVEGDES
jgi:hypothetical protein